MDAASGLGSGASSSNRAGDSLGLGRLPGHPGRRTRPFSEALQSDPDIQIDYFAEYLESDVFPADAASLALADYIRRKYRGRRIDVVIAIADPALQFVLDHRDELFPDAPIVYSGVAVPEGISRGAAGGLTARAARCRIR